jgi:glucose/mannose-6-phosphate isomerase
MYETILKTPNQFAFEPKVINAKNLKKFSKYLVVGMGGSHLAADLIKMWLPELDLISYQDYGLPNLNKTDLQNRLIIFSSYSGNTEEVIDSYLQAGKMGLNRAVISVGGQLLELAKKDQVAYVQMPDFGIQPRSALPLSLLSFLLILGQKDILSELKKLEFDFHPEKFEIAGQDLTDTLRNRVPIIYSSASNKAIGYIWKINFNETGKIPAFNNVFPELNHNEMNGFGVEKTTVELSDNFYFIFLSDKNDSSKIKERMEITDKLYSNRNLPSQIITLGEANQFLKFFNSLALVEFAAYFTAQNYGLESEQVPMIEEFKKML